VPFLGLWSIAVFLFLYNSVHLFARVWLFAQGYRLGEGVIDAVSAARVPQGTGLLKAAAAVLAGAVAARSVLLAGLPSNPGQGALAGAALVAFALLWPRLGLMRAVYLALLAGIALGASIL
jgi:hypothetical protein